MAAHYRKMISIIHNLLKITEDDISMKKKILIIALWLCIWQFLAVIVQNNILLVGPIETCMTLSKMIMTAVFWQSVLFSFERIMAGFFAGSMAGVLCAVLAYKKPLFGEILAPLVMVFKTVPVASFVILLLIWSGNAYLSLLISMIVVFPILYLNTLSGLQSTDRKLLEMSEIYHMTAWPRIRYIFLPRLYPFLLGGFKLAIGMSWKSGIAAEVIGQPFYSIGNGLYRSKIYLATGEVLAWTIVIIGLSWSFEWIFLLLLKQIDPDRRCRHQGGKI